jgi:hypothetical protein
VCPLENDEQLTLLLPSRAGLVLPLTNSHTYQPPDRLLHLDCRNERVSHPDNESELIHHRTGAAPIRSSSSFVAQNGFGGRRKTGPTAVMAAG